MNGINYRLTEFQGALLLAQLTRLEDQQRIKESNAAYLSAQLIEIPGITPARMYEGLHAQRVLRLHDSIQ